MHPAAWANVKPHDCGAHEPPNCFGIRSRSWIDAKHAGEGSVHSEMQGAHQPQAQAGEVCQGCLASEDQTDGDEVMTSIVILILSLLLLVIYLVSNEIYMAVFSLWMLLAGIFINGVEE